jgi:hypothetical protein
LFQHSYLRPILSNRFGGLDNVCSRSAPSWMLSAWRASRF